MFGNPSDKNRIKRMTVTAQELFNFGKDSYREVDLPELGGVVYMRDLSAREVLEFNELSTDSTAAEKAAAQNRMLARSLVNENGARIIPPGEEDGLSDLPMRVYLRLINAMTEGFGTIQTTDLQIASVERGMEAPGEDPVS